MSERTVWAVKYGNYEPAEVVALYEDKIDAQTEATRRNHEANTGMWEVGSLVLRDEAGRAVQDDGLATVEQLAATEWAYDTMPESFDVIRDPVEVWNDRVYPATGLDKERYRRRARIVLDRLRAAPPLHDPQEPADG